MVKPMDRLTQNVPAKSVWLWRGLVALHALTIADSRRSMRRSRATAAAVPSS